jgi:hypothetical protein
MPMSQQRGEDPIVSGSAQFQPSFGGAMIDFAMAGKNAIEG